MEHFNVIYVHIIFLMFKNIIVLLQLLKIHNTRIRIKYEFF